MCRIIRTDLYLYKRGCFISYKNSMDTSNSFLKKACPASAFFFKKLTNSIFYTRIMWLSTADTIFAIIQLQ